MTTNKTKMINCIKKAIMPLTPVLLKDIPRPQTVEEGRANLRRFYGCVDGNLQVLLHRENLYGEEIRLPDGERVNGVWYNFSSDDSHYEEPHEAIVDVIKAGSCAYVSVDPDKLEFLTDLYGVTKSGCFNGGHDPSFSMNLIMGGYCPIPESTEEGVYETWRLICECRDNGGRRGDIDTWLSDPTVYHLFSNRDNAVKRYGSFYSYVFEKNFRLRWRQMNNQETRYLHWLLLGPFAPYQYCTLNNEVAA